MPLSQTFLGIEPGDKEGLFKLVILTLSREDEDGSTNVHKVESAKEFTKEEALTTFLSQAKRSYFDE